MRVSKHHRIVLANDGSPSAESALRAAVKFPWPESSRALGVIARMHWRPAESQASISVVSRDSDSVSQATRRELASRWPKSAVRVVDRPPADAILEEAGRFKATAIVLGWRGHGTFHRLLAGSVSRAVAARANCPVLIARHAPSAIRRFVVGYDGCENAQRAIAFLCSLKPLAGSRIVLVNVIDPIHAPRSLALLPKPARAQIRHELKEFNQQRLHKTEAVLKEALTRLTKCGWSAKAEVRSGAPLSRLLSAVSEHRADVLVVGARAVTGIERALLGSVANGAVNRSPVPVLLVR